MQARTNPNKFGHESENLKRTNRKKRGFYQRLRMSFLENTRPWSLLTAKPSRQLVYGHAKVKYRPDRPYLQSIQLSPRHIYIHLYSPSLGELSGRHHFHFNLVPVSACSCDVHPLRYECDGSNHTWLPPNGCHLTSTKGLSCFISNLFYLVIYLVS